MLSVAMPEEYKEELDGIQQGMIDAGYTKEVDYKIMLRILVITQITGNAIWDLKWVILGELGLGPSIGESPYDKGLTQMAAWVKEMLREHLVELMMIHNGVERLFDALNNLTHACSSFGVWGNRTKGGKLYGGRNLDWVANTGASKNKLMTVIHPPKSEGLKYPHVNFAFAGMWGALAGMNSKGVFLTEIGNDSKAQSWLGLAWTMRMRFIMENAEDLPRAMTLWNYTNNTNGIMHGIGSSATGKYAIIETNALRSAYFLDNDIRQQDAMMDGKHYGYPLVDAVWRTGHAYDPEIKRYSVDPYPHGSTQEGSMTRYLLAYNTFLQYEAEGANYMDDLQAVNVTAVLGDKGGATGPTDNWVNCTDTGARGGSNVLSVTFSPDDLSAYVAYDNGVFDNRTAACCMPYVFFNFTSLFEDS